MLVNISCHFIDRFRQAKGLELLQVVIIPYYRILTRQMKNCIEETVTSILYIETPIHCHS
jgi:hypothetical protein